MASDANPSDPNDEADDTAQSSAAQQSWRSNSLCQESENKDPVAVDYLQCIEPMQQKAQGSGSQRSIVLAQQSHGPSSPACQNSSSAVSILPLAESAAGLAQVAVGAASTEQSHSRSGPATNEKLHARMKHLANLAVQLGTTVSVATSTALSEAIDAVGSEVHRAADEASGLAALLNDTLQQVQRLTSDNRELRRREEDAVLDTQLKTAQEETERLRIAGDAYKRELLEQKLSDTEWILATELERLKESETDKEALATTVKELRAQLRAGGLSEGQMALASLPAAAGCEAGEQPLSSLEREELATQLTDGEGDRRSVDAQVLVKAAKGLRDTAVLEQHLQQSLQEKQRLANSVDELQDIVYSKTFKAPSAWADRERKYKMEKLAWETQAARQHDRVEKLRTENKRYRDTNRTAEFEAQAAKLQAQVEIANAARVKAQQEAHELRLKQRPADGEFTNDGAVKEYISPFSSTVSKIDKLEQQHTPATALSGQLNSANSSSSDIFAAATTAPHPQHANEVSAAIHNLNEAGIGTQRPKQTRPFNPGRTRISRGGPPPLSSPQPAALSPSQFLASSAMFRETDSRPLAAEKGQKTPGPSRQIQAVNAESSPSHIEYASSPSGDADSTERPAAVESGVSHRSASPSPLLSATTGVGPQGESLASVGSVSDRPVTPAKGTTQPHAADSPARKIDDTVLQQGDPSGSKSSINSRGHNWFPPDEAAIPRDAAAATQDSPSRQPDARGETAAPRDEAAATDDSTSRETAAPRDEAAATDDSTSRETAAPRDELAATAEEKSPVGGDAPCSRGRDPITPTAKQDSIPDSTFSGGGGSSGNDIMHRTAQNSRPEGSVGEGLGSNQGKEVEGGGMSGGMGGSPRIGTPPHPLRRDGSFMGSPLGSPIGRPPLTREMSLHKMYGQQVEGEDVGALRYQAAELTSRLELMQTQLSKAALAAERGAEDRAHLEAELTSALNAAAGKADQSALDTMQGRLQELLERRGTRDEEAAKKMREWEQRLRGADTALHAAHREHQVAEKRLAKCERQLAITTAALGPQAASVLASDVASSTSSGDEGGTPRHSNEGDQGAGEGGTHFSWGNVSGVTDEDLAALQLREENELLMESLVRSKLETAELQNDYLKTKRALIRAVEKQAEMSESMDLLKSEVELSQRGTPVGLSASFVAAVSNSLHRHTRNSNT